MIRQLLVRLGIPGNYLGHGYLIAALTLCLEHEEYLHALTKQLYPSVAKQFQTTSYSVERNLRTVIQYCWTRGNRRFLEEIAGYPLLDQPSPGLFLSILLNYLRLSGA